MMKTKLSCIALAVLSVSGCASFAPSDAPRIVGHQAVGHGSMSDAEAQYAVGKYYLGQKRAALALLAFTRALEADPQHAEAYNARATAFVQLGDLERAEADMMHAIDLSPEAAHLLNNQGYVQILREDYEGAARSLRQAFELEPRNPRVVANWKLLSSRVSTNPALTQALLSGGPRKSTGLEPTRVAEPTPAVVSALSKVFTGPVINLDRTSPVAVGTARTEKTPLHSASKTMQEPEATTTVLNLAHMPIQPVPDRPKAPEQQPAIKSTTIFSSRVINVPAPTGTSGPLVPSPIAVDRVPSKVRVQRVSFTGSAPATRIATAMPDRELHKRADSARIQVANGNGVRGMAARFSQQLPAANYEVVRISNASHFRYGQTRIYFRDGYQEQALQLSRSLPVRAAVMLNNEIARRSDLQVVLGRDLVERKVAVVESVKSAKTNAIQLAEAAKGGPHH